MLNSQAIAALNDLTDNYNPDVIAFTETWIGSTSMPAEVIDATPPDYSLFFAPRFSSSHPSKPISAGGTAFILKESLLIHNSSSCSYSSFEYFSVTLKLNNSVYFVQYLPITSSITLFPTFLNLHKPPLFFPMPLPSHMNSSSPGTSTYMVIVFSIHKLFNSTTTFLAWIT